MRYSPWDHLQSMEHVTFGITHLPVGDGWWLPDLQAIALDKKLDRVGRRVVLAHECVHAELNDMNCHLDGPTGPKSSRRQETRADKISSKRLVTLDDLAEALSVHPLDPDKVAEELDVTKGLLRIRLQHLTCREKTWIEKNLSPVPRSV